MASTKDLVAAQKREAKHAKRSAHYEKMAAHAELESAQAEKGKKRVKQPEDFSML